MTLGWLLEPENPAVEVLTRRTLLGERRGEVAGLDNIDTEGERYTWMFRTMLRIVAEELRAEGAVPAKIVPFPSGPIDAQLA